MVHKLLDVLSTMLDDEAANGAAYMTAILCGLGPMLLGIRLSPLLGRIHRQSATIVRRQALSFVLMFLGFSCIFPLGSRGDREWLRSFLPAEQGFLFVLAARGLSDYGVTRRCGIIPRSGTFEGSAFGLFLVAGALLVARLFKLGSPAITLASPLLIGAFFNAAGYYLMIQGCADLTQAENIPCRELNLLGLRLPISKSKAWRWLAATTVVYFVFGLKYVIESLLWLNNVVIHHDPMTPLVIWTFTLLTLNLWAPFLLIIKREAANLMGRNDTDLVVDDVSKGKRV